MDEICILTQELLPLYAEDACSPAAVNALEKHLKVCADCRERLTAVGVSLPGEADFEASVNAQRKEFLRPAAPLARVWRRALRRAVLGVLAVVLAAAALLLTVGTLRGDGYTWFTLPAYITAEKLADAAVDMHPIRLRRCVAFTGVGPQDELEMRSRLQALAADGVVITDGRSELRRCAADDGVQELSVFFTVEADGKTYTVEFPGSLWEPFAGKAALRYPLVTDDSTGRYAEPAWADALADALCTHDPG